MAMSIPTFTLIAIPIATDLARNMPILIPMATSMFTTTILLMIMAMAMITIIMV